MTISTVRMATVQMTSSANVEENVATAANFLAQAATAGAQLAVLPENFAFIGQRECEMLALREISGRGPLQTFLSEQAALHKMWIVGGTIPLCGPTDDVRALSSTLLFGDNGECVARYDKVHLFDVQLDSGERYTESAMMVHGNRYVTAQTPWGKMGLAVCYDLRFPEQFRAMVDDGIDIIALPAAFTATTGQAHWEVLLRARAIENQCLLIAAAQVGTHANGRETYGHSMIIDPWGEVLGRRATRPGMAIADYDMAELHAIRRRFPVLRHRVLE